MTKEDDLVYCPDCGREVYIILEETNDTQDVYCSDCDELIFTEVKEY